MAHRENRKPYKLPEPLYCDPDEISGGITMEIVDKYIRLHETRLQRYRYLENLYKGFHDIFNQPEKPEWKPDNRMAVNFPRYITDTFDGYGYGIPVKTVHPDDHINELIADFERENEMSDHYTEMVRYCCMYGHAWEYLYQDEDSRTCVSAVTPKELFCVYDDTMKRRALFAVRYGYHESGDRKGERYGEILTREGIEYFDKGLKTGEPQVNQYGRIPVVEWQLNSDRMGLYEPVTGLIELYNHTVAEKANDVDAFAEAYLAVLGAELDEEGIYRIRDNRIINLFGTDDAKDAVIQFLQKPTADGTQENLLDRIERLIFQISMVANISDESFGSATSGAALSYKLWSTSNVVRTFNTKIEKSLRKRFKLWCSLGTNCPNPDAWRDLTFTFSANVPKNIQEETATAVQASGLVSQKTQLGLLSYVSDVDAEMEQMVKEQEEQDKRNEERMNRMYGGDTEVAAMQLNKASVTKQIDGAAGETEDDEESNS